MAHEENRGERCRNTFSSWTELSQVGWEWASQQRKEEIIIKIISGRTHTHWLHNAHVCVWVVIIMLQGVWGNRWGISSFSMPWQDLHFNGKAWGAWLPFLIFVLHIFYLAEDIYIYICVCGCKWVSRLGKVNTKIDIPPSVLMPYECG